MAPKDGDTMEQDAPAATQTRMAPFRRWRRILSIAALALLGPVAALTLGIYIYLSGGRYMATDNAFVKSAKIVVSTDVSGRVDEVAVTENQKVAPGDLLFRLEQTSFRIARDRAEAQVLAARQRVEALRASFREKQVSLNRAENEIKFHELVLKRQRRLARKKLVSGLNLETAVRNLRDAQDQVKVAEQALAQARARLGGDPEIAADAHPQVLEAIAVRDEAGFNLKRTEIRASKAGVVTNFDLQKGEYVTAGKAVFSLVGTDTTWVHANYKETELTNVRVGQRATVSVDTYPDRTFNAVVAGISPATGAEFALLPPQNATGNWVKVVQRLTVRLKLDEMQESGTAELMLRAGMSAHVEIDTENKRKLSGIFAVVADWTSGLL